MDHSLKIIQYNPVYARDFYELNIEWLRAYFYVEPYDEEVLSNPEKYILDPGGYILFALKDDVVAGTLALMPTENQGVLELTKMAVAPGMRGQKIGQHMMNYSIDFARQKGYGSLLLYSNTILENAIYIYRKYGFKEVPLEPNSPYKRSNIKMVLNLD